MPPVLALALAEIVLVAIALAAGRGNASRSALVLVCLAAPLEVYRTPLAGYNISLFRISVLLAIAVLVATERRRLLAAAREPVVIAYLGLVALMAISLATTSDNPFLGRRVFAQTVVGVVGIAVVASLVRRQQPSFVLCAAVGGAALPLLAASLEGIAPLLGVRSSLPLIDALPAAPGLEGTRAEMSVAGRQVRLKSTFGDPNHFGVYLTIALTLAGTLFVTYVVERKREWALTVGGVMVAAGAVLVATYSRSAWLAALVALVLLLSAVLAAARTGTLGSVTPRRIAVAGVVAAIAIAPLSSRIVARLDPSGNKVSIGVHSQTTDAALASLLDSPIFGIGLSDLGPRLRQGVRTSGAHSSYLTFGAELGLLGLLAIAVTTVLLLASLIQASRRLERGSAEWLCRQGLLAAYVGFLAGNITYDLWLDDFHWLAIGAIVGIVSAEARGLEAADRLRAPSEPRLAGEPATGWSPSPTPGTGRA